MAVESWPDTSEGLLVPIGQMSSEELQELLITLRANSARVVAQSMEWVGGVERVLSRKAW